MKVFLMIVFLTQICFSYDYIGEFIGGRAIVKEGNKWGIIDKNYKEYFFSDRIEHAGKVYGIKKICNFEAIGSDERITNSPTKPFYLAKIIFNVSANIHSSEQGYYVCNVITTDGKLIMERDYESNEVINYIPNERTQLNWDNIDLHYLYYKVTQTPPTCNPRKIGSYILYLLSSDSSGVGFAYKMLDRGQFDYCGQFPKDYSSQKINFNDFLLPVANNNKWGYIDGYGELKTELNYKYCGVMKYGVAIAIDSNNKYVIIDRKGKEAENKFDLIGSFSFGTALALNVEYENPELFLKNPRAPNKKTYKLYLIDKKGKILKQKRNCLPNVAPIELWDLNGNLISKQNLDKYKFKYKREEIKQKKLFGADETEIKKYSIIPITPDLDLNSISYKWDNYDKGNLKAHNGIEKYDPILWAYFYNFINDSYIYSSGGYRLVDCFYNNKKGIYTTGHFRILPLDASFDFYRIKKDEKVYINDSLVPEGQYFRKIFYLEKKPESDWEEFKNISLIKHDQELPYKRRVVLHYKNEWKYYKDDDIDGKPTGEFWDEN